MIVFKTRACSFEPGRRKFLSNEASECVKNIQKKGTRSIVLKHDRQPAFSPRPLVMAALEDGGIEVLRHPLHSPELATSDLWLFLNVRDRTQG